MARSRRPARALRGLGQIRLRWVIALVPAACVVALELFGDALFDQAFESGWDKVVVTAVVALIGLLAAGVAYGRMDALTGTLRARNAELEARSASARALHRVSVAIATLTDVDHVLQAVVTSARELLAADVVVLLLEGDDGRLERRAAAGDPEAFLAAEDSGSASGDIPDASVDPANPADAILACVKPGYAVVRLSAPLRRGGRTLGLLAIGMSTPRGFDADEVETLASLANQAAIALEHARLEARLRELAVVEERERIARELHDGIAQVLGYVNTKSQAIDGYLAAGRVEEARHQVGELGAAARAVYVDVREAILGLRSPIEPGQGLGAAIEAHARRVAADSGFVLDAEITPDARDLRLEPRAEANLYKIVQEALTNVRKHAAAGRVRVSMAIHGGRLTLRIRDDGRGMAASAAAGDVPHYGIRSMHERAAAIRATLNVADGPRGVVVEVELPLAGHLRGDTPATVGAVGAVDPLAAVGPVGAIEAPSAVGMPVPDARSPIAGTPPPTRDAAPRPARG